MSSVDVEVSAAAAEHDQSQSMPCSSTYSMSEVIPVIPISPLPQPKFVRLHWHCIKENERIVKLYTGCPSAKIFKSIVDHVRAKQ